jgi:hypothetical protein
MAIRSKRLRRPVDVYEFAGIDHNEHQLWIRLERVRSWGRAAEIVDEQRSRPPVSTDTPTVAALELGESLSELRSG